MTHSKRRMAYKLGTDKLEKAKPGTIKTALSKDEDAKLSRDMQRLYEKLLPSSECEERRRTFVKKLEKLLNTEWPGHDIRVHVFGSSGNMLCTDESDVDICITTEWKELERVCMLADLLARHGMTNINCVSTAKVPIVKVWDPELSLACDMNVNNTLALENTRMIKTYVDIDWRVRPLAMIIKHWTKRRVINDAAFGGTLSSYTWICMIINFLQLRSPPILPCLHEWKEKHPNSCSKGSAFADNMAHLRDFGKDNKQSLGELVFQFFRFYAHDINYDVDVVSVRSGKLLTKETKGWAISFNNSLCVEEPFNTSRNLGNTADDFSFRGLHLELRRAFDLISRTQLEDCCEQYNFPKEEERIWEKPPPAPRPLVISRSVSQTRLARGGGQAGGSNRSRSNNGHNGNHNHNNGYVNGHSNSQVGHNNRNAGNIRRASSVTYDPSNGYPTPVMPNMQNDNSTWMQNQQHTQAQLAELYMNLEAQKSNLLRLQLYNQEQGYMQSDGRHTYHPSQNAGRHGSSAHLDRSRGFSVDTSAMPNAVPTTPLFYFYPVPFHTQQMYQQQSSSVPYPSSPAIPPAIPEMRRSLHRSSVATPAEPTNLMTSSAMRSHSQPAIRTGFSTYQYGYPVNGLPTMPQPASGQTSQVSTSNEHTESSSEADSNATQPTSQSSAGVEKDYKGYVLNGSSFYQNSFDNAALLPPVSPGRRRVSTEQYPQALLRRASRSPSPLGRGSNIFGTTTVPSIAEVVPSSAVNGVRSREQPNPAPVGLYAIPARRKAAAASSFAGSTSDDQSHDTMTDSTGSLSHQHPTNGALQGHAETRGLGLSFDFSSGMDSGRNTPSSRATLSTPVQPISEEVLEANNMPRISPVPLLEPVDDSENLVSPNSALADLEYEPASPKTLVKEITPRSTNGTSQNSRMQHRVDSDERLSAIAPAKEARSSGLKMKPVTDAQMNGRASGSSHERSDNSSRKNSEKKSHGHRSHPGSSKGHVRNVKSEGSSLPWSHISKHKKKPGQGQNDKSKANAAPGRGDPVPARDSERKGG